MGELINILNTTYDKIERIKPPEILGIEEKIEKSKNLQKM